MLTATEILKNNKGFAAVVGAGTVALVLLCYTTFSILTNEVVTKTPKSSAHLLVQEFIETQKSIAPPDLNKLKHKIIVMNNDGLSTGVNITRGWISSPYGYRAIFKRYHHGIDIAAPTGTKINAYDGGVVTYSGRKGTYGLMIELDHGNGRKTRYAHCSALYHRRGDTVTRGEHIADVGNTGRSTGPHLHFELLINNKSVNPQKLFTNN